MDDFALLQAYVKERSDAAFDELMRRHLDLVYTAARRRTADAHLAEDVTQAVFIVLAARKAESLKSGVVLPAWLLHVTRLTASNALRQRKNQSRIERKAAAMTTERTDSGSLSVEDADAVRVAPLLDDAIAGLAENDRNALVLRYFSRCSMAELGQRLGVTPAAAEKRVSRATERLRESLVRGGVVLSLLALIQVLMNSGVSAAPAEIAGKLSRAVAAGKAGIQMTPSVELANFTMQGLKASSLKPLIFGAAALIGVSFLGGALLIYMAVSRLTTASAPPPAPAQILAPPLDAPLNEEPLGQLGEPRTPNAVAISTAKFAAPPFTPPEVLVPAQGPHHNLLARVDLAADNLNGEWTQAPGSLQSGPYAFSVVQMPYCPPEEYDFHATFKIMEARGEIVMVCARKGADFAWKMGAHENTVNIFDITPGYSPKNSSRRELPAVFVAGRSYDVTVQVRNNGVAAYIDGKLASQLATDYRGFGVFHFWQLENRAALGIGAWATPAQFDALEVVEVSGPGVWLRAEGQPAAARVRPAPADPAAWSRAVDLMPLIDPDRDAVSGLWVRNADGALTSDNETMARLEIPYKPPEEYDYKMVFTRNHGWDSIAQCFGHANQQINWGMAMWGNQLNMFRCVSAFEGTNPTTVWAKDFIENGRRYESVVQVRSQGYAAFVDGRLISFWNRGYKDGPHSPKDQRLPTPGLLGLATSKAQTTFHSLQVLEITGTGTKIPVTASKRIEAAPVPKPGAAPANTKPVKPPAEGF